MFGKSFKYSFLVASVVAFSGINPPLLAMDYTLDIDETIRSQNFRPRGGKQVEVVVLHCVGLPDNWVFKNYVYPSDMSLPEDQRGLGVSAHYYVSQESKKIYQLVPDTETAYHAGISDWRGRAQNYELKGLNDIALGVEFQSLKYGQVEGKEGYFPYAFASYTQEQMGDGIILCQKLMREHNISPENVVWHSDVSPGRKTDPGPHFNGERLAAHGIGVWPFPDRLDDSQMDTSLEAIQMGLKAWGYPYIEITGAFDQATKDVLTAHYMHYLPTEVCWADFKDQQKGSIFDKNTEWKDFPYDKEVLSISLENLTKRNFNKYNF